MQSRYDIYDIEERERTRQRVEQLLQTLGSVTPEQMSRVAGAWREVPRHRREAAVSTARRLWRATASDDALVDAFAARRTARRTAEQAGLPDDAFPAAAWDATLAVASGGRLDQRSYEPLVSPLAHALPWLLAQQREPGP